MHLPLLCETPSISVPLCVGKSFIMYKPYYEVRLVISFVNRMRGLPRQVKGASLRG